MTAGKINPGTHTYIYIYIHMFKLLRNQFWNPVYQWVSSWGVKQMMESSAHIYISTSTVCEITQMRFIRERKKQPSTPTRSVTSLLLRATATTRLWTPHGCLGTWADVVPGKPCGKMLLTLKFILGQQPMPCYNLAIISEICSIITF